MTLIRKALLDDAVGISKVHVATWKSTYHQIVEDSYLEALKWENRVLRWEKLLEERDNSITFVALKEEKVIGFASGGICREAHLPSEGELYAIYIHPDFQRQKIGEKLFSAFMEWAGQYPFHSIIVRVLEESPYKNFYLKMNGQPIEISETHSIGGKELKLSAYTWEQPL